MTEECCDVDPSGQVATDILWDAWQKWCRMNGSQAGSRAKLGTDLRGCRPEIERLQFRVGGKPTYCYRGLQLNAHGQSLHEDWRRTEYRRA